MVEWLAGGRIRGTSAERTNTTGIGNEVGGWVEVARTTLGSTTKPITVSSIPDKRYYMILVDMNKSGNATTQFRYGNSTIDTGSNYADRGSYNGVVDGTPRTSASTHEIVTANAGVSDFLVGHIANLSAKEKLMQYHWVYNSATTAGTAPERAEKVGKWTNGGVSAVIDTMQLYNSQSGNYLSGSEVVVLGWDTADTHTTNFWEELASVTLGSAGDNLSSGTITAKKYLWFQAYIIPTGGSANCNLTFNNDTGSNYSLRYTEGTNEPTLTGESVISMDVAKKSTPFFINGFVINNSANEKLTIIHQMNQSTATAGYAPTRNEIVGKWSNTSAQITEIDIDNPQVGVDYAIGSMLKVWGSN